MALTGTIFIRGIREITVKGATKAGQFIQQCAGAEPVATKQANQRDDARCQTRHDQHRFRQLIREILLVGMASQQQEMIVDIVKMVIEYEPSNKCCI